MCRLAAYCGAPCALETIISLPPHSLIEQSHAATEAKLSVNGDGFGFAWYAENELPGLYREVMPAWTDGNLLSLARTIRSRLFLAHVRASTFGQVSRTNCHPFTYGKWAFMHNGQISEFAAVKRSLENCLPDQLYNARHGNTDSELIFLLLVHLGIDHCPATAIHRMLHTISSANGEDSNTKYRMTCVLTDGDTVYAWRTSSDNKSPTLYSKRTTDDAQRINTVIASEPIDDDNNAWQPIPENHLVSLNKETLKIDPMNANIGWSVAS